MRLTMELCSRRRIRWNRNPLQTVVAHEFIVVDPEAKRDDYRLLERMILESIVPATWKSGGGKGTLRYAEEDKAIVVHNRRDAHSQIAALLHQLRKIDAQAKESGKEGWTDVIDFKPWHGHGQRDVLGRRIDEGL